MKSIWVIAASAVLAWAAVAQAGPLDLKYVPADAKWVAHVDLDAAHSSPVMQKLFQECAKDFPRAKERLAGLCQKLGLERCADLHGITAYGVKLEPRNGVLILQAKWNAKALREMAEKAPDHKTMEFGTHKVYAFTAHKGTPHAHEVAGTLYKPDTLVLASSPELLKSALNVLDGKAPALAGKASPLAAEVPAGDVFLARAVDLNDSAAAKMHPALQLIKSFNYAEGQHDGKWFANLTVTADSKPVAEKVAKVLEGYGAWLSLHSYKSPWFVGMLDRIKVSVDGNAVKVTSLEPADALAAHMPELCKAMQEHLKMRVAMMKMHCEMAGRMARPMGWGKPGGAPGGKSAAGPMPMCPMMGMMCPMGRGHRPGK